MKKMIALLLSIFTILLVSTSAFAAGLSGGVNGDGDFTGGGFTGGSRLSSVFGSSSPASSSLSTLLSYEALNNLTANINLGISLGEIEILDGNIQSVTVTKRTDWNAYVITGVYNGNTYVIVNASGGRYYSPINEGYFVTPVAGTSYYITDRPAGTVGNGYLGDLRITKDNILNIQSSLNGLGSDAWYYTSLKVIDGQYRYYLICSYPNTNIPLTYVCNSGGQLYYAFRDEVNDDGGDTGGGGTFDPTEVITAINSVYDAINSMSSNVVSRLATLVNSVGGISSSVETIGINMTTGFESIGNQLSTLNSYFTDLSGLFPVQETITLLGSDTRVAWDSADRITNVTAAGFNGDLIVKERPGDLVDESGYEKVTINETEYSLYNDNNGYRRIKANNEYPDTGTPLPDDTLFYFPFENTLASSVGDFVLTCNGTPLYSSGVDGMSFEFDGNSSLAFNGSGIPSSLASSFTYSFWFYPTSFPAEGVFYSYEFQVGSDSSHIQVVIDSTGYAIYQIYTENSSSNVKHQGGLVNLNTWNHFALCVQDGTCYMFTNGNLDYTHFFTSSNSIVVDSSIVIGPSLGDISSGSLLDDFMFINGTALWKSSFNPSEDAIFSEVAKDYFLPCTDQEITLNFYDSTGEQVTEYRWNQYTVNTSRLPDGYTELEYIQSSGTQYIDTGVIGSSSVDADFMVQLMGSGKQVFLESYTSGASSMLSFWSSDGTNFRCGRGNYASIIPTDSVVHLVSVRQSSVSVDGVSYSIPNTGASNTTSFKLFCECMGDTPQAYGSFRLYYCQFYDNGTLVRDFVPCKNPSNAVGLYDLVGGQFYGNSGTGSFTAGNEVSNGSGIGQLVGVVSSTNRNAYPDDGEQNGFYYEYIGAFTEYPSFSQTLSPTDVNGNAITMGRLEDDFSEIYMDISTMMWYCHDPQTQTEILLSSANQAIMNDTIYVRQNYTMLPADQITADALQNLLPVDSPVYLDMPEGAKLTITYDHYSGWFRMMYILMDKQTKLLSDLDIVNETIINVENTVIDITNSNPAYNVFYITKTDGTTESVGDAAKDAAVFVGDILSMFYRLVFDDALDNVGILNDFEGAYSNTEVSVW